LCRFSIDLARLLLFTILSRSMVHVHSNLGSLNMKNILALLMIAGLLLGGCAKKPLIDDQVADEPVPVAAVVEPEPPADPVQTIIEEIQKTAPERVAKIFFAFDSAQLTPASREALQANALWLNATPEMRIVIEGHTDERGSNNYNLGLGEKRAQAARAFLLSLGIAAERIATISYGEEKPAMPGSNEEAWAQNRRALFQIAN
jgi:peptidoglycan-associated lipoprotein